MSQVISPELLKALASLVPEEPCSNGEKQNSYANPQFDLSKWIVDKGLAVTGPYPWNNGQKWLFPICPWNPDHTNRSAFIIQFPRGGAIAAGCQHNGCAGKGWHDLRDAVEPGWRERKADNFRETDDTESHREENTKPSPWVKAKSAPDFCAEEDKEIEGYAKDLVVPGTITVIAAPRGIGKTLVLHALAVAMAKGEYFRGEKVKPLRVMLVDRDNPRQVVRQRIRGWGGNSLDAKNLKVITREDAPDLKDKTAWEAFPVKNYDVVLIDSLGSFTEGVTEKEGKETTQMLATLLDFIRKGPAVVALTNCTKDALNTRGRGEWQDRVDIQYEVRDATDFTPSGKKDWWLELPEAGESAWADRAARRKSRIDYRLAFTPSKFRLGAQPDPFCLEIRLPKDQVWSLDDVTKDVIESGENTIKEAVAKKAEQEEAAANALADVVRTRHQDGNPILKTQAEIYLNKEKEIPQKRSRELIKAKKGTLWDIREIGGKGAGSALFPIGATTSTTKKRDSATPPPERISEGGISVTHAQSGRQEYTTRKPAPRADLPTSLFSSFPGVSSQDERLNGTQKEVSSSPENLREEEHYLKEERAGIQDDDGFEGVPK